MDERHIGEDIRVSGKVSRASVREADHVPGGLPTIDDFSVIQNAATVYRVSHRDGQGPTCCEPPLFIPLTFLTPLLSSQTPVS